MRAAKIARLVAVLWLFFALLASPQGLSSAANKSPEVGSIPVNGLQMSISYGGDGAGSQRSTRYVLVIAFRNLTRSNMALLLGGGCNAKAIGPTMAVDLNLTGPDGKVYRNLPFLGEGPPYQAGCAGGLILSIVTLQPGEAKSFPFDLSKYLDLSGATKYREMRFPAGTYSVQAALTVRASESDYKLPDEATARIWTGTITSNVIPVRFEKEFAAPLGA